ncbi:DASS family sodium-coupled anion symporter [Mycobacterium sp. CVI_P3]|uniref:Sodium-dependent dicarboxylate transporter SdcS n=1 Tax=Mycobacterium pinniadriaticum TaxID=2994102 RepID=A0ABT3SA33_9MYCO|nr:DASS family sodium-coupled anion symporter [Mycobacterium pinniadriaticum]MCX2929346.1 DASS family sodium-coupled anion symporter [Mycobacterium pinniadriaticum]MCX2935770.1 DASS family sodium-coupled anion symporter [Mycobacterium pinniadriaticum]
MLGDHGARRDLERTDLDPNDGAEVDERSAGEHTAEKKSTSVRRWIGFGGGLLLAVLVYLLLPADLSHAAKVTAGIAVLMGMWWMTEAIPIPATALVPLVAFPVLVDDMSVSGVGAYYGSDVIFLFMGGFLLALAMQRWNLHRRIALLTVRAMGTSATRVIAGFMLATGFLSMWVSNTATAVMMVPIGVSVLMLAGTVSAEGEGGTDAVEQQVKKSNFGTALMLGIAYAASAGSLATIIGTPPNVLLVGYLQDEQNITIGFGQWMLLGLPLAAVLLVVIWLLLAKLMFKPEIDEIPGGKQLFDTELDKLGATSSGERRVTVVFVLAAVSWISFPLVWDKPPVSDAGIAVCAALLLFVLPAGSMMGERLLDWATAVRLPWAVLLLFGGGLALSAQFSSSGLTAWIGLQAQSLKGLPVVLLVGVITTAVVFLTEVTSNTATAATFLPVIGGAAVGIGQDPLLLTIPVALAATAAFMLPVATPPNAIVFGTGYVNIGNMVKGGIWLNLASILLISVATTTLAVWVFNIAT